MLTNVVDKASLKVGGRVDMPRYLHNRTIAQLYTKVAKCASKTAIIMLGVTISLRTIIQDARQLGAALIGHSVCLASGSIRDLPRALDVRDQNLDDICPACSGKTHPSSQGSAE